MRDLRIGAALAVTFASLLAASIAFAQQPPNPVQNPPPVPGKQSPSVNPIQRGEDPPPAPGQVTRTFKHPDDLISAKESPEKAENDERWWLDRGTALSSEQKQKIYQAITARGENRVPARADLYPQTSTVLPTWVVLGELPDALRAEIPYIRAFKVVLTGNKVLLVDPVDRAVATVIDENS
jgi:hypothetical protein